MVLASHRLCVSGGDNVQYLVGIALKSAPEAPALNKLDQPKLLKQVQMPLDGSD